MSRTFSGRFSTMILLAGAAAFLGCQEAAEAPAGPGGLFAAAGGGGKPTSGPSVTAADPAYGNTGDVAKRVTITGSGFTPGAQAAWERGGAADPKVQVLSTEYVSSTQLVATITIASDAAIDLYDISVTALDRKKGIGYMLFEVTQAVAIEGTGLARGVNENGQTVGEGGGAFFWGPSTGLEIISSSGAGMDLSEDGLTVVGGLGGGDPASKIAVVWTRSGGAWVQTLLPRDPAASAGNARAVASDPMSGSATIIGGVDTYVSRKGNSLRREPRLWIKAGAAWQRIVLPLPDVAQLDVLVIDVNADGVAVGNAGQTAVVWEPNGVGGWTAMLIGPHLSDLNRINSAGTIAVGRNAGSAAYWQRVGGAWTGPHTLPVACGRATDVDDLGRIVVSECDLGPGLNRTNAAVIGPPYTSADVTVLGGFGAQTDGPQAEAISKQGSWIVGRAKLKSTIIGAYWQIF